MTSTVHQFECRDELWSRVETLAGRRGLSSDQVVEAALVRLFTRPQDPSASKADGRAVRPPGGPGLGLRPVGERKRPQATGPLYVRAEGRWYTIDTDRFIIGRGAKHSDLAIRDANISRQHCEIVREGNGHILRDLGSTNGVEYEGRRVDLHKIEENMSLSLCDHELYFTYRPPPH